MLLLTRAIYFLLRKCSKLNIKEDPTNFDKKKIVNIRPRKKTMPELDSP